MTIEIANRSNPINANNLKSAGLNKTEAKQGNFSAVLNSKISNTNEQSLEHIFEIAGEKYNIPVNLLKSVAKAESGFNPMAESKAGAQGIMQLMPATARSLGVADSFNTEQNVMGGAKYLRQMLDRFEGDVELSLAAYNAGPGNVLKYEGIPPFKETQNYVTKVMGYFGQQISPSLETISSNKNYANLESLNSNNQADELLQAIQGTDLSDIINKYDLNSKEYALMMDLYRCKVQMGMFDNNMDFENI